MPSKSFSEIQKDIQKKSPKPIYFLYGSEPFFLDQLMDSFENDLMDEMEKGFNFSILYGRDVDANTLMSTCKRYPMMSQYQVVLLKEAQMMKDWDKMDAYFDSPMDSTVLVIAYKSEKLDKRKKLFKELDKNAILFESKPLYDNQVASWLFDYAKEVGYQMDEQAAHLLAEFCGTNLSKIHNEFQKIKVNIGERKTISAEDVHAFSGMNREYNVFELQKAIATRNPDRVIQIFQFFANNPKGTDFSLIGCLALLYGFYSKLWVYQTMKLQNQRPADAAKMLGMKSEWAMKDIQSAARIYPAGYASRALKTLLEYDLRSKGVNNGNTEEAGLLKELAFRLLQG